MTVVESTPMKVLLERVTAGFRVEVGIIPTTGECVLRAYTENYHAKVPILPEKVLEAFHHPCAHIPDSDRFFRELKEGESAEADLPSEHVLTAPLPHSQDPRDYCSGCNQSLLAHEHGPYCENCQALGS